MWAFRAAAIVLPMLALVAIPEIALRLFWRPTGEGLKPNVGTGRFVDWLGNLSVKGRDPRELFVESPELLWKLRAGATIDTFDYFHAPSGERQPIRITINREGYRGALVPTEKKPGELRVLCLGDSNLFGYPLDDADGLCPMLERALGAAAPGRTWTVINGGTPGYTVLQGWRAYESKFARLKPDFILLSFLNNDAWQQQQGDAELLERCGSAPGRAAIALRRLALFRWMQTFRPQPEPDPLRMQARVPTGEYEAAFRKFFAAARDSGAAAIALDYRVAEIYAAHSEALRDAAKAEGAPVVVVRDLVAEAGKRGLHATKYKSQYDKAVRRWGEAGLREKPFLAYYAEPVPDHLNETGVAFLADEVAAMIAKRAKSAAKP